VSGEIAGHLLSIHREKRVEKREKKDPAAKPAPPTDTRFQPFVNAAFESYKAKHGREPLWQGKDFSALGRLLKSQSVERLPLKQLVCLWGDFLKSTELFTVKQGDSLAYFCSNLDKFVDGPILAVPQKGGCDGIQKPTTGDNIRVTLDAFRQLESIAGKAN
jgi:hypothetical protein